MKNTEYNGYKNYSYWNQSLYINNNQDLYTFAMQLIRIYPVKIAALVFINSLVDAHTPDSILWTKSGIYSALMSLKKESI